MRSEFPEEVIAALRNRKLWAFDHIYNTARVWLYTKAYDIVQDESAAQDLVQDLFIDFWEQKRYINIATSINGYLLNSIRNRAYNYVKRRNALNVKNAALEHATSLAPVFNMEQTELKTSITKAMAKVPLAAAEAFHLHYIERLSHKEIAEIQGVSKNTVRNQISSALKILRNELKNVKNE
jgi:RNA polymerase sigma-70 factor (family 1)